MWKLIFACGHVLYRVLGKTVHHEMSMWCNSVSREVGKLHVSQVPNRVGFSKEQYLEQLRA